MQTQGLKKTPNFIRRWNEPYSLCCPLSLSLSLSLVVVVLKQGKLFSICTFFSDAQLSWCYFSDSTLSVPIHYLLKTYPLTLFLSNTYPVPKYIYSVLLILSSSVTIFLISLGITYFDQGKRINYDMPVDCILYVARSTFWYYKCNVLPEIQKKHKMI